MKLTEAMTSTFAVLPQECLRKSKSLQVDMLGACSTRYVDEKQYLIQVTNQVRP